MQEVSKKLLGLLFLTIMALPGGNAMEMKDNVCIVRQSANDTLSALYENTAKALVSNGYFASARTMRAMGKAFGSGIVYKAKNGKPYIVTNHHVVGNSHFADIEFRKEDGTKNTYEHCKVLGVTLADDEDVALIELPDNLKFTETINPYRAKLKEGDEVWTAGYPGLGNEPIWQLGKGILSNVSVKPEGYTKEALIQHTAQVDPGNSGGPLLMKVTRTTGEGKKETTVETYEVVGLNTWKARFRENTNYAIPFSMAERFIDSVLSQKPTKTETDLKAAVDSLVEATKAVDVSKAANYVWENLALKNTAEQMKKLLKYYDSETQILLRNGEAIDGLVRLNTCNILYKFFKKRESLYRDEVSHETDREATVVLKYKGKAVPTKWIKCEMNWKLADIDLK